MRLRAVLVGLAALLLLPLVVATPPAGAAQVDEPRIDIVSETPTVTSTGTFVLGADLRDAPAGSTLHITLHRDPLADRDAFSRSLFGVDLGDRTVEVPAIDVATLAPAVGGGQHVTIAIALQRAQAAPGVIGLSRGLVGPGVYPLDLRLTDPDGAVLARIITHLVRLPDEDDPTATPLRTALLLGLDAPPTVGPTGVDTATDATFRSIRAVAGALAAQPDVPLTLDPTPETMEALARVDGASRDVLAQIKDNLAGREVLDGPYVHVPLTAWVNAGMGDDLRRERVRGLHILTELLDQPDSTTWVAGPDLTTEAASTLWELGVRHLVLRPGSFIPINPAGGEVTLSRPFQVDSPEATPLAAVAIDTKLQQAFTRQADPELTAYQVLAELSMIEAEDPASARGVVVAAPPGWQASTPFLTTLMSGLADNPLLAPVTLDDLFRDVAPARSADGSKPLVRPLTPLPPTDLGTYPADLARVREKVASFTSMVGTADPMLSQWDQRLLLSGSDDLSAAERAAYLSRIEGVIDDQLTLIEAPDEQTVTLTASDGSIPLTLRSRMTRPVKVVLALESSSRLEFPDGTQSVRTLEPGLQQVRIRVRSRSPGDTPLTIRVLSPDSGLDLTGTRITVRSTAVSGIGYVLSGGAALFLVVWWARSWRRSRRDARGKHLAAST